jgi:hypothetical protein
LRYGLHQDGTPQWFREMAIATGLERFAPILDHRTPGEREVGVGLTPCSRSHARIAAAAL